MFTGWFNLKPLHKRMRKLTFFCTVFIIGLEFFSPIHAADLAGTVLDEAGSPISNANIYLVESSQGTTSDSTGFFEFQQLEPGHYHLKVTHVGFNSEIRKLSIPMTANLRLSLRPTIIQLSEIMIQGTLVDDIRSPVSFSSLNQDAIQDNHIVEDIPLLLQSEPGVYVSNDAGSGFGDSRIMIRGFDEKRIQVMINNIPVNDPETKEVAWSNWSALPEAAQTIQVQRGVGTSLYGSSAIGGAINIVALDALSKRATELDLTLGAFGTRRLGLSYHSGQNAGERSLLLNLGYLEGSGWRENTYYQGLQYYLALNQRLGEAHLLKMILHGAPQYHTLAFAGLNAASYGESSQFSHDSLKLNDWGLPAYGFGKDFNANVHTNADGLSSDEKDRQTGLLDALLFRSQIGVPPREQVGGYVIHDGRVSMNNNVSHRPQFELHHSWFMKNSRKLTSTVFMIKGLDYSDDVYPAWFIPRGLDGTYDHDLMTSRAYWGGDQVFEYRYYSDFSQVGFLSVFSTPYRQHELSVGFETRRWSARHAGEVLNNFGAPRVDVPIGSVLHPLAEGDLFYDFTTTKPQATFFGHADWHFQRLQLMTNFQLSSMRFQVLEAIPSNNNYPNHLDPDAASHAGGSWTGTAVWDNDNDPATAEALVAYTLWDYSKSFSYFTPRLGLSYQLTNDLDVYANLSIGIKEPEIKHFYAFGAPQNDLELERTRDVEMGLHYSKRHTTLPYSLSLTAYHIDFAGKLMQITIPEKANTPGYDYAGHTYVPVGDAQYSGLELSTSIQLLPGLTYISSLSQSRNVWGEPDGTPGAQKLYGNVALAGVDFEDLPDNDGNYNQVWDEGGKEQSLHHNFVSQYGARYDVGMPQFIWNSRLEFKQEQGGARLSVRHFKDLYVLENNSALLVGAGADHLFFTEDDDWSSTLPAAWITDLDLFMTFPLAGVEMQLTSRIKNVWDTSYWQRGDEFGVIPGAARTWLVGLEIKI